MVANFATAFIPSRKLILQTTAVTLSSDRRKNGTSLGRAWQCLSWGYELELDVQILTGGACYPF